jgi:DNA modification methylase
MVMHEGDALQLLMGWAEPLDLVVTDPPYAFGGSGTEHAVTATVAVVLRGSAERLRRGSWMVVLCASSWRCVSYMVESVRGVVEPVRLATWTKPESRTKVRTAGWAWANVTAIAFRKGPKNRADITMGCERLDHIERAPVMNGRRAELPTDVARWAVSPFVIAGGRFLDPFAGSGALPRAASALGMEAHGFEIDPPTHDIQCDLDIDCSCGAQP